MRKRIMLHGLLAVAACAAMAGCDTTATDPDPAGPGNPGGKGPQALGNGTCVDVFPSITHCGFGATSVEATGDGISASNFTGDATSGISSSFAIDATNWQQQGTAVLPAGGFVHYDAILNGTAVSSLVMRLPQLGPGLRIAPTFTAAVGDASNYNVAVYHGNDLVGSASGIPSGTSMFIRHPDGEDVGFGSNGPFRLPNGEEDPNDPNDDWVDVGGCTWTVTFDGATEMVLPDGRGVLGDRVELVEEITGGSYPYGTFGAVHVWGLMDSYTITSETVSGD